MASAWHVRGRCDMAMCGQVTAATIRNVWHSFAYLRTLRRDEHTGHPARSKHAANQSVYLDFCQSKQVLQRP